MERGPQTATPNRTSRGLTLILWIRVELREETYLRTETDGYLNLDFWGPVSNFGIPVAAVMDTQKSPEL
jgi:hypothetical protein